MTDFVKTFIKNNIDFINDENCYAVSREWYEAADRIMLFEESDWFKEFCETLSSAGIDYLKESEEDRKRIVELNLIPTFDQFVASQSKTTFKENVMFGLASTLGLDNKTVEDIADKIAKTFNLHVDFEHYEKLR